MGCEDTVPASESEVQSALFVGNSLIYYNDLPTLFDQFAALQNSDVRFTSEMLAEAGVSLSEHLDLGAYESALGSRHYDLVILQEVGGWPLCAAANERCAKTEGSLAQMDRLASQGGAIVIWLGTWHPVPEAQAQLSSITRQLGSKLGIEIVDAGGLFTTASEPPGPLLLPDYHPDVLGSWMLAAMIYAAVTGEELTPIEKSIEVCHSDWRESGLIATALGSSQEPTGTVCETLTAEDNAFVVSTTNNGLL